MRACVCVCVYVCGMYMRAKMTALVELQRLQQLSTKLVEKISVHIGLRTLMNCTRLIFIIISCMKV